MSREAAMRGGKKDTMSSGKPKIEHVQRTSPDLLRENIDRLKDLFPEVVTEGRVDFDKLRAILGDEADGRPERYSFTWAGKRDAIQLLQTPSRATLVPAPEESINFDSTNNVFIEGDNLEVLKLLYQSYAGRVKMIYIDPPYNTGNDFIYPDNFADPLDTYLKLTGQKDSEGNLLTSNPETSGRYHSAWLSMMYPRLFQARQMLAEDGVIMVSIADHELKNLLKIMDEVFGEENFIANLIWKSRQFPDSRATTRVSTDHEYIVVYARRADASFRGVERDEAKFSNPDNDPHGDWMSRSILGLATKEQRPNLHYAIVDPKTTHSFLPPANTGWRYSRERMQALIADGRILFPSNADGRPREKKFKADLLAGHMSFPSIIDDVFTAHGTAEVRELFGFDAFDFPKPSELLKRLVRQVTSEDDIVMDIFAGSGTTAQAMLSLNHEDGCNRRWIMVQLPEQTPQESELQRNGYATIAAIGIERIRRVIKNLGDAGAGKLGLTVRETPEDLGFKVFKLTESNYRQWEGVQVKDGETYAKTMEMFTDSLLPGWEPENVICEVAIREGYSLTFKVEKQADIKANEVYRVTDPDKGQTFRICLDGQLKAATVKALNLTKDDRFICRDVALTDELAANLALQCNLRTI